ncbi:Uncharacterised protein [uncultured archaeon]|nr:Uncharacterised protein [uncultured archaeon]
MVELYSIPIVNQMSLLSGYDMLLAIVAAIIVSFILFLLRKPWEYFKKLCKWLLIKIKQLIQFIKLVRLLWKISTEAHDSEKMIDFVPCYKCSYPVIKAPDSTSPPCIEFEFAIINRSIFDFKIEKISMNIHDNDDYSVDKRNVPLDIDLPHQQVIKNSHIFSLNPKFIDKLKSLKEKCESQWIILEDVKIYLKNEKSPIFCGQRFNLRIHHLDYHL